MKIRYTVVIALLSFMTASAVVAQTPSAGTLATKARTARSVANDLRTGKVQKATATTLKDKDVQRYVKLDKELQDKMLDPNMKRKLADAKREAKRDPVTFGEKQAREISKYKKYRPWWLGGSRKRSTKK